MVEGSTVDKMKKSIEEVNSLRKFNSFESQSFKFMPRLRAQCNDKLRIREHIYCMS